MGVRARKQYRLAQAMAKAVSVATVSGAQYVPFEGSPALDFDSEWDESYLDFTNGRVLLGGEPYFFEYTVFPTDKRRSNGAIVAFARDTDSGENVRVCVKFCFSDTAHLRDIPVTELGCVLPVQLVCSGMIQIMPYCEHTLSDIVVAQAVLDAGLSCFMKEMAQAVSELNTNQLVYSDFKPENILLLGAAPADSDTTSMKLFLGDIETLDAEVWAGDTDQILGSTYPMRYDRIRVNRPNVPSNIIYSFVVLMLAIWLIGTKMTRPYHCLAHERLHKQFDCVNFYEPSHKYHDLVSTFARDRPASLKKLEKMAAATIKAIEAEPSADRRYTLMTMFFRNLHE